MDFLLSLENVERKEEKQKQKSTILIFFCQKKTNSHKKNHKQIFEKLKNVKKCQKLQSLQKNLM